MLIRSADQSDLEKIISWIRDQKDCLNWAGPLVRFPVSVASLAMDISLNANSSYVLEKQDALLAFGQLLNRGAGCYHLARIIVAPEVQGQGYGRIICEKLVQIARAHQCQGISLKVYRGNKRARSLYHQLGFCEVPERSNEEICHLEKRFP